MEKIESTYFISKVESDRFKMNIIRGKSENINLKSIQEQIIENNVDILFLRIPSSSASQIQNLSKLGYEYFQADTLVYYFVDFGLYQPKSIRNIDLVFKKATINDKNLLKKMVSQIFVGYSNHYFSNLFIEKKDILEGYSEWVENFVDDSTKDVFIVYRENEAIAFATCSIEGDTAEGVLYGVMPNSSGGGVYSDIIRYTQEYYNKKGLKKMIVSTQIQNFAVQKVWGREGFYIKESYATIHINSILNYSRFPVKEYYFNVTEDQITQYANISNDFNIIHFDDAIAQESGFKGKIAHGLLASGEISRILGTDFPGEGTIFMNYKNIFLSPMYPDNKYKFVLTTPFYNDRGMFLCVVKVFDSENNLIMLSYNQLIKK